LKSKEKNVGAKTLYALDCTSRRSWSGGAHGFVGRWLRCETTFWGHDIDWVTSTHLDVRSSLERRNLMRNARTG
jgi:hypothetical protein